MYLNQYKQNKNDSINNNGDNSKTNKNDDGNTTIIIIMMVMMINNLFQPRDFSAGSTTECPCNFKTFYENMLEF